MLTPVPEDINKIDRVRRNMADEIFILSPLNEYNIVILKSPEKSSWKHMPRNFIKIYS
jgi:hypothetical protein